MSLASYLDSKKKGAGYTVDRTGILGGTATGGFGVKSIGEMFTESQAFKDYLSKGMTNSDVFKIPNRKDLVDSVGANGALLRPWEQFIINPAQRPFRMRDLLAVAPTTNNAVDYLREETFQNNSAVAPEGTLKAESAIEYNMITQPVITIAHHIPMTRQAVSDIPALQQQINQRLLYGLQLTEDAQILFGNGTSPNMTGLMVDTAVQVYAPTAGDTKPDQIRKAMTRVFNAEYPPTGIVLNPTDWEDIELLKSTQGEYILESVNDGGAQRLFGVPVVVTTAMTAGSFLIGAFGLGAQLFDREEANIRISEHNADDFVRNQIRILAEERLALCTYRPTAFVRGVFA
jgi:HK97 family phage major capsid protein